LNNSNICRQSVLAFLPPQLLAGFPRQTATPQRWKVATVAFMVKSRRFYAMTGDRRLGNLRKNESALECCDFEIIDFCRKMKADIDGIRSTNSLVSGIIAHGFKSA
jgi:hypothetical protein